MLVLSMFVDGTLSCWVIERSRDLEVFFPPFVWYQNAWCGHPAVNSPFRNIKMVSRDEIFTCLGVILFRVLGFQACIDVVKDKLKGVYTFAETLNLANACCEGLIYFAITVLKLRIHL